MLGQNDKQKKHEYLYWQVGSTKKAVRAGKWKAVIVKKGGPIELYDLSTDIGETNNIANKQPGIVKRMEGYMRDAVK